MDAQRNRERILEVAKEAFTRFGADASLAGPGWQQSARSLVDILITGSRPVK
jgi:hypothetical protein